MVDDEIEQNQERSTTIDWAGEATPQIPLDSLILTGIPRTYRAERKMKDTLIVIEKIGPSKPYVEANYTITVNNTALSTPYWPYATNVAIGNGTNQRVGRSIFIEKLEINMEAQIIGQNAIGGAVRVLVVLDRCVNQKGSPRDMESTTEKGGLLTDNFYQAFTAPPQEGRYTVLCDNIFTGNVSNGQASGHYTTVVCAAPSWEFETPIKVDYIDGTEVTRSAETVTNGIFVAFLPGPTANPSAANILKANIRITFTDS